MSGTYSPWTPDSPGRTGPGGSNPMVAMVIGTACLLVLAGALISGLTLDASSSDGWELKAKIVGLSGFSFVSGGGVMAVGAALVLAAMLAGGDSAGSTARLLVGSVAAWLIIVGVISTIADISILSDSDDGSGSGFLIGAMVSDIGGIILGGAAGLLAFRST